MLYGSVIKNYSKANDIDIMLVIDKSDYKEAKKIIESIVHEYQVGEIVEGPVSRLFDFGAMVKIGASQEGLIHISELAPFRVEKVTDVVKEGQIVKVKVIGIDEKGRVNLSLKRMDSNFKPEFDQRGNNRNNRKF